MMKSFLGLLAAAAFGMAVQAHAADFPAQVQVDSGGVRGVAADGVLSFKGVPFAKPPVGDLRWRAPQPVTWTGVRAADAYGHDCMQTPFPSDAAPLGTKPDEDCLVLNLWRPAGATKGKLPVMVWIYGGGFVNGGSSPAVYDGSQFARRGVVFVSFNYRVGRFGFFAHPALTAENPKGPLGNYGYMDQIAALKWVKRNIASFGGDPANVTVFGESAGGGSVHMLMTSPQARGLFAKAGVESGGGRASLMGPRRLHEDLPGAPSAETIGVNFAHGAGIDGADAKALAALRALPQETVNGGLNMGTMQSGGPPTYAGPMLDGTIVTEDPQTAYLAGRQAKVPLLIGANTADIGFAFAKTMDELMARFPDKAKALAAYDPSGSGNVTAVAPLVGMDQMMVEPVRFVARTLSAQGQPVYAFRFGYVANAMRKQWPGAPHATEIPFVFDTVSVKYGKDLTPADEAAAQAANAYWANFAKTGNPNGAGLPKWPAYTAAGDRIMVFTNDGPKAGPDPLKARMDAAESAVQAAH